MYNSSLWLQSTCLRESIELYRAVSCLSEMRHPVSLFRFRSLVVLINIEKCQGPICICRIFWSQVAAVAMLTVQRVPLIQSVVILSLLPNTFADIHVSVYLSVFNCRLQSEYDRLRWQKIYNQTYIVYESWLKQIEWVYCTIVSPHIAFTNANKGNIIVGTNITRQSQSLLQSLYQLQTKSGLHHYLCCKLDSGFSAPYTVI